MRAGRPSCRPDRPRMVLARQGEALFRAEQPGRRRKKLHSSCNPQDWKTRGLPRHGPGNGCIGLSCRRTLRGSSCSAYALSRGGNESLRMSVQSRRYSCLPPGAAQPIDSSKECCP